MPNFISLCQLWWTQNKSISTITGILYNLPFSVQKAIVVINAMSGFIVINIIFKVTCVQCKLSFLLYGNGVKECLNETIQQIIE
jgi:hypothetical protein